MASSAHLEQQNREKEAAKKAQGDVRAWKTKKTNPVRLVVTYAERKSDRFKALLKGVINTHVNRPETPEGCKITPEDVNEELDKALQDRFYDSCRAVQRGKFKV